MNIVFAARRNDPKLQLLVQSIQASVNMTNSSVQLDPSHHITVLVREVGDFIDEVTQGLLSIQLLDKPDILLTAHSFHDFKLMAGMAHSGGFPVWSIRNMIEWGNFNEQPDQYGNIAVVPKLSLIQGMSDAKGQLLYDLVAGLGLDKVLEITVDTYACSQELTCSSALTDFHSLVKINKKKIEIKQLEVEEGLPQQDLKVLYTSAIKDLASFEAQVLIVASFLLSISSM